jgi:hypothetical protein
VSFLEKMKAAQAELEAALDPWHLRLERLRGTTGFDGLERVSTQTLMDILEVPQRQRTAGNYRHLASLMTELGWNRDALRDLTRGGYREQVRVRSYRARFNEPRIGLTVNAQTFLHCS